MDVYAHVVAGLMSPVALIRLSKFVFFEMSQHAVGVRSRRSGTS